MKGLLAGMVLCGFAHAAKALKLAPPVGGTNEVVEAEKWTADFAAARAQAERLHRPMLLFAASKSCTFCSRLEATLTSKSFQKWVQGTGLYLVEACFDETNKVPAQLATVEFMKRVPFQDEGFPYVGIYWPKAVGEPLQTTFIGRRGKMPGASDPKLMGEFFNALEDVLKDHLATLGARSAREDIMKLSEKKYAVQVEGPGRAHIRSKSAVLVDATTSVKMVADFARGARFVGWRDPTGKMLKSRQRDLSVRYSMPEGTYTAVFAKKDEKKKDAEKEEGK